jgi:aminopeptidase N
MGLLTSAGRELPLQLDGESAPTGTARLLLLEETEQSWRFVHVGEAPVPSLLRGFSAPVKLHFPYGTDDLALLMTHDTDAFVRWEAAQLLAQREILDNVTRHAAGSDMQLRRRLIDAYRELLTDRLADPALVAEAMALPDEEYLADQMAVIDVDGIHAARDFVQSTVARELERELHECYRALASTGPYDKSPAAMARRSLRNLCLSYLLRTPDGFALADEQLNRSDNMTDTLAALQGLLHNEAPQAPAALAAFEERWRRDALVMDKWFTIQACVPGEGSVERVRSLLAHPAFSITNPNKVRSLLGAFATMNPTAFHTRSGAGYRLHADQVIALNALNPQVAARMAAAFNSWTRYDSSRQDRMRAELLRIASADGLSSDVSEIVHNALDMGVAQKPV